MRPSDAKVFVSNVAFRDWNATQAYSTATFQIWRDENGVRQTPGTNNLVVTRSATIEFIFDRAEGFTPLRVFFTQTNAQGAQQPDPDGQRNFPSADHVADRYLFGDKFIQIRNRWLDRVRRPQRISWDFYIEIRDAKGDIGRLHPEVSNSDESQSYMGHGKGPARPKLRPKPTQKKYAVKLPKKAERAAPKKKLTRKKR